MPAWYDCTFVHACWIEVVKGRCIVSLKEFKRFGDSLPSAIPGESVRSEEG